MIVENPIDIYVSYNIKPQPSRIPPKSKYNTFTKWLAKRFK